MVKNSTSWIKSALSAMGILGVVMGSSFLFVSLVYSLFPGFVDIAEMHPWLESYAMGVPVLFISLLLIWMDSKGKYGEYGFTLKRCNLRISQSLWVGILFGISMAFIDFLPPILRGSFSLGYDPIWVNVLGRMSYVWIFVGLAEETLFRGLIQSSMMNKIDGNVRVFRWRLQGCTIVAASMYGVSHLINLFNRPLGFVVPQVIYTTVLGLFLGYIYQETGSLAGPIVSHNLADGIEYTIEYLLHFALS